MDKQELEKKLLAVTNELVETKVRLREALEEIDRKDAEERERADLD